MSASMKLDLEGLRKVISRFSDPGIIRQIEAVPQMKALAALVGQAIADNFAQQGPGWAPLKAGTIRSSVAKKIRKGLSSMSDKELLAHEAKARKEGGTQNRMILQRTRLLYKSVTVPGFSGDKGGNIYRMEGTNLVWGTSLPYAGIHNTGGTIRFPGTNKGFGIKGLKIPAHDIKIPKRKYLYIQDEWMGKINNFMIKQITQIIKKNITGGG